MRFLVSEIRACAEAKGAPLAGLMETWFGEPRSLDPGQTTADIS